MRTVLRQSEAPLSPALDRKTAVELAGQRKQLRLEEAAECRWPRAP